MSKYLKDRSIIELPMPMNYKAHDDYLNFWLKQLNKVFFFKNQQDVFDCFLLTMNQKVYVSYNVQNNLSYSYSQFMLRSLPKNIKDKKRRFYKP